MYTPSELYPDLSPGRKCAFCHMVIPRFGPPTCSDYCFRQEFGWYTQINKTVSPREADLRRGREWLTTGL